MSGSTAIRTAVYVISLDRSTDRRADFEAHAEASRTTVPWSYYAARTQLASELRYDPHDAMMAKGRALYPPELGVYSSHYTLWRKFLDDGADQILVLEDDVVVDWNFVEILSGCDLAGMGLDYLKLFNKNITPFRVVSEQFHRRTLIDCRGFAHGMQAYMLTRKGAKRFLDWCQVVRRPIDDELDRSWGHGIPNVAVFPFPAFEKQGPSTIGFVRYEQHAVPLAYRLGHIRLRALEKVRRGRQRLNGFGHQPPVTVLTDEVRT